MNIQKVRWERMAKRNAKYYINASKGKKITEKEFRQSGEDDYLRLLTLNGVREDVKGTFLEIGCGNGRMTEFIAQDWDKVVAVDISGEMIRQGKKRLKDFYNIEWHETDGQTVPLKDNSVDFAFSYLVFQHIKTKGMIKRNFKEVLRVLKPNGVFLVFLRHKEENMSYWSSGVAYNEATIPELLHGFKLLRSDYKDDCYTFWLWLKKDGKP